MKKKECKSIYDLAEITGVSYATVSRVLNNRGRTAEATRKIVMKAAADYNFKPKMKARRQTVGIVIGIDRVLQENRYGYLDMFLIRLLNDLSAKGYSIEFFTPHNLSSLQNCLLDGLICMYWDERISEALERMHNLPAVMINSNTIPGFSRVYSDHEQSGRIAAEYLIDKGHSRAGIILDSRNWGNQLRAAGFVQAFAEKGVKLEPSMVGYLDEQAEAMLIKNMLSSGVSALFLGGEDTILQLNSTIQLLNDGKTNPLTIISMENASLSRYLNPPMTTVSQPFDEITDKVIELLVSQIDGGVNQPQEFKLDNILIVRNNDMFHA